jgi:hypothetical protein
VFSILFSVMEFYFVDLRAQRAFRHCLACQMLAGLLEVHASLT